MLLIIQTGDPVASAQQRFGRFSDWFINGLKVSDNRVDVIDVHRGQKLPALDSADNLYSGIIITGSAAMVTNQDPWLLSTQNWLSKAFKQQIPTLGICYGHQVLADLLGGVVDYNPRGRNMGLSHFQLADTATQDELLKHLLPQTSIPTFASHLQSVISLPQSAELLGTCALDPHHAFRAEDFIWGLQFHPEWHMEIMQAYIQTRSKNLISEGFNPTQMINELAACDAAYGLLQRFTTITDRYNAAALCA